MNEKHVSETSSKDKLTLETELENVRERLTTAEMEKSELSHQVKLLKDELDEIETKMKSQSYQLVQAVQDLNDQKSASAQIRLLAEESRNALDEHRMQLKLKNDEIQRLDQHKFHLEQKLRKRHTLILLKPVI
jgi:predicted  nucleic acid-binding Zn-ribbon protein